MPFTITNRRNDSQFTAAAGESILDAAMRDNRIYPYGCRNGLCGACKSTLLAGRVVYDNADDLALTAEDLAQGKVLLCQAVPCEDVVIDAEEVLGGRSIQIKMLPCRVGRIERVAADVMRVFLRLPKSQGFAFIPGQYIDIIMKDGGRRSFSIANLPTAEEGLELHIRHVPGGRFTPQVFGAMRERDLLRLEGPFGTYFLQTESQRPMIMIAGGTGFAPIQALLSQALGEDPQRQIHLFWGARDEQDLYRHAQAQSWAQEYPNFTYTPVLSATEDAAWHGARGWVHEAVLAAYTDFAESDVYASGPPVMIDAVRDGLSAAGMQTERFFFDSFTYAPQAG